MLTNFDIIINSIITKLQNPGLTKLMIILTDAAGPEALLILSGLLILYFVLNKKKPAALLVFFTMAGGAVIHLLLKELIERPRPVNSLIEETGFSMPSGHATMAAIFFSLIIYLFKDKIKNKALKYAFIALNILLIISIGFSRIYLGVHWPSDVLAGFALGIAWIYISIIVFKKYGKQS